MTSSKLVRLSAALALFTSPAWAGSSAAVSGKGTGIVDPVGAPSGWDITGAAGLSLSDGNSDTLAYSVQVLASYLSSTEEIYLGADYFYGESGNVETTNAFRVFGQYNRLLSDRLYVGLSAGYLTDDVANLDYRIDTAAVLGYYLIKNDRAKLSIEAGPGYTWEKQGGLKDDYFSIRFAEKFDYQISAGSKLWQSAVFQPEGQDFDNYLLTLEAGIDTLITSQWAFRTFVRHQIDSTPALGREKDDTTLMVGLAYSLGGFPEPKAAGRRTLKAERESKPANAMGWTASAALGYSLASGNADTTSFTAMFDAVNRSQTDEILLSAAAGIGENGGVTTASNVRASAQYNRLLGNNWFLGLGSGFVHDDVADLSYRLTPALTLGYYLIKNDTMTLSLEAGPGYTFERVGGINDDYAAAQATERFTWNLNSRCTLNQSFGYNAPLDDLGDYTLTGTAFVDTDITESLAFRVAATYIYDSSPAAGLGHHDTTLTSGIAVRF